MNLSRRRQRRARVRGGTKGREIDGHRPLNRRAEGRSRGEDEVDDSRLLFGNRIKREFEAGAIGTRNVRKFGCHVGALQPQASSRAERTERNPELDYRARVEAPA